MCIYLTSFIKECNSYVKTSQDQYLIALNCICYTDKINLAVRATDKKCHLTFITGHGAFSQW